MLADPEDSGGFESLMQAADWYRTWLMSDALRLWASAGVDPKSGAFLEALRTSGEPHDPQRRARVQARQVYVFASAACDGFLPSGIDTALRGWRAFEATHRTSHGLFISASEVGGAPTDLTPRLYEHAFVLLAMSALHRADPGGAWSSAAVDLLDAMQGFRHSGGGFREEGAEPFQATAQMHLLEAALAWEGVTGEACWKQLADEVATLALLCFIDAENGVLREFYYADWTPRRGETGLIEPGHQFEWGWLLNQWGRARARSDAQHAARRLFDVGGYGYDGDRRVAIVALWDDLTPRDTGARLWAQTEHLRAALAFGDRGRALSAADGLATFLQTPTPGTWHERMRPDGRFLDAPSPATSLYHLYGAVRDLCADPRAAREAC